MTKYLIIGSVAVSIFLISAAMFVSPGGSGKNSGGKNLNNVTTESGKQVIEISARGGYFPRISQAKAGVDSVIKMTTNGTFDCSSSVIIPSLNYQKNLPMTGETLIDLPAQQAGTTLQGYCAMGMYNFQVEFE